MIFRLSQNERVRESFQRTYGGTPDWADADLVHRAIRDFGTVGPEFFFSAQVHHEYMPQDVALRQLRSAWTAELQRLAGNAGSDGYDDDPWGTGGGRNGGGIMPSTGPWAAPSSGPHRYRGGGQGSGSSSRGRGRGSGSWAGGSRSGSGSWGQWRGSGGGSGSARGGRSFGRGRAEASTSAANTFATTTTPWHS